MKKSINFTVVACLWVACWTAPFQKLQAQAISPNVMEITYVVPGSYTITVPARVVNTAEAWGGGGGGGSAGSDSGVRGWGGGGGGGAYTAITNQSHSNPISFNLTVGKGGDGGDANLDWGIFHCYGGEAGGNTTVAVPAFMLNMSAGGGEGGDPGLRSAGNAGGGGAPGGNYDVGTPGQNGGTGGDSTKGGDCPNGGAGAPATQGDSHGSDGDRPGGGGAGAKEERAMPYTADGGNGGDGRIRLTLIFPVPAITSPTTQLCQGSVLRLSVTDPAFAHVNYTWYRNGVQVGIGTEYDAGSDGDYTVRAEYIIPYTGASPIFRQASGSGNSLTTTVSNTITLTVSAPPQINPITMNSCSGEAITVTPMNGVHGFIPNGITYQWTVLQNTGGITGAITGNSGVTSLISLGTLVNPTNTTQTIVFEVTPGSVGCTNVTPFQISVNVKPAPQINPMTRTVCSGESISITPTNGVDGVVPGMTAYLWTVVSNTGVTGASSGNSGNSSTIYLGTLTNTTNAPQTVVYEVTPAYDDCTGANFQLSITVNPAVAVLLISDNNFYWDGGSAQLTAIASPAGSYTYDWYRDNLLVLANGGDTYTSSEPARFAAYNYHVTVNDGSCTGVSNVVPITVSDAGTVTITLNYTDICESGTLRATVNIVQPGNYSFKWFLDNVESGYGQQFTATNLPTGTYTLYVEVTPIAPCTNCGINSSPPVSFDVHPDPVVTIAADNAVICTGSAAVLRVTNIALDAAVNNKSHYTLQWTFNGTVINGALMEEYSRVLSNPGVYTFTVRMLPTDDVGCASGPSASVTVTVAPGPQVMLVSAADACCVGESVLLTANATPAGAYVYDWYRDNVLITANGGSTHLATGLAARATSYKYHVVVRSAAGCDSRSNEVAITVSESQEVVVTLNYTDICQNGVIRATANIAQPENYTFKWYLNGVVSGYERLFSATGLPVGANSLRVEATPVPNCVSCRTSSASVTFNVHYNPLVAIAADKQTVCAGSAVTLSVTNITLNTAVRNENNYTLQWTLNGTVIDGAIHETYRCILPDAGVYTFSARMIQTNEVGCTSPQSSSVNVTATTAPQVVLVSDNGYYHTGGSVTLTAHVTPSGAYTYDWYCDNTLVAANGGNTYISKNLSPRTTDYTYHVIARSTTGCDGRSNDVAVMVGEAKTAVVMLSRTDICQGGVITATAGIAQADNYSFKWYLNDVEKGYEQQLTLKDLPVGVYTLYVDATPDVACNDCVTSSATVSFAVHSDPVATIAADQTLLCGSGTVTLMSTGLAFDDDVRNDRNIRWQWAVNGTVVDGATQNTYSQLLEPGVYNFTMRLTQDDDCGCASEWSAPVTVTVADMEIPAFFVAGCETDNTNDYRIVQLPLTVRSGNPKDYRVTYADMTRSSLNHAGAVERSLSGDMFVKVHLPLQAGDYELTIAIDGCLYAATGRVLVDSYALGGARLIEQRWDDVLTVNNNPETNGGFTFYAYQWYKDDVPIPAATGQYYTEKDGKLNGAYQVELRGYALSASGQMTAVSFISCPFMPLPQLHMSVYPVPVFQNQPFTFTVSLTEAELDGATLDIYDATGKLHRRLTGIRPIMSIVGLETQGIYFGRLTTLNNGVRFVKFIVR